MILLGGALFESSDATPWGSEMLERKIRDVVDPSGGEVAVYCRDLGSTEAFELAGGVPMHAASIVFPGGAPAFALVILTRGLDDREVADTLAGRISRIVYDHHLGRH